MNEWETLTENTRLELIQRERAGRPRAAENIAGRPPHRRRRCARVEATPLARLRPGREQRVDRVLTQ